MKQDWRTYHNVNKVEVKVGFIVNLLFRNPQIDKKSYKESLHVHQMLKHRKPKQTLIKHILYTLYSNSNSKVQVNLLLFWLPNAVL